MTKRIRTTAIAFLLAACATTGGGGAGGSRYKQADAALPAGDRQPSPIEGEAERAKYGDAWTHIQRGQEASNSGNTDQARAEWNTAADMLASIAEQHPTSDWRIPFRYQAARYALFAAQPEKAANEAERVLQDPEATPATKAMASHLAAAAWQQAAVAQTKAGKVDPIKLPTAEQRKGTPLAPKVPAPAWKRFIDAADTYAKFSDTDPDLKKPAGERLIATGPAQLELIAAEVEYSSDNMEDARGRLEQIIQRWPAEADVMDPAVQLYLQTFLVMKDRAGYQAALDKVNQTVSSALADAQKSGDTKKAESLAKVRDQLAKYKQGAAYDDAAALLESGKATEAAAAFEKVAQDSKGTPDAASALYNAAIAWSKAEQPDKAAADAQAVLEGYADSKVAPKATLMLAGIQSKKGEHAQAAKTYAGYLEKWPQGENRCIALQNAAYEHDVMNKKADAAGQYLTFGKDEKCAKDDPNSAAKALFRAGRLFLDSKQKPKAKEAYQAATQVQGVTDTVAKSQVEDAKKQLKRL